MEEYNNKLLRFLVTNDGINYLQFYKEGLLKDTHQINFVKLLKHFYSRFEKNPTESSMLKLLLDISKDKSLATVLGTESNSKELVTEMSLFIRGIYRIDVASFDSEYIAEFIKVHYSKTHLRELSFEVVKSLKDLTNPKPIIDIVHKFTKAGDVLDYGTYEDGIDIGQDFFSEDYDDKDTRPENVIPTFIKKLNATQSWGGFYSPQVVMFMKQGKAGVTKLMLKFAVDWAMNGYNVVYADFENGKRDTATNIRQSVSNCTHEELNNDDVKKHFKEFGAWVRKAGGSIRPVYFRAGKDGVKDLDTILETWKKDEGYVPHIIIYDYLWKMLKKGGRDNIQESSEIVFEMANLNKKWDTFSMTVHPVTGGRDIYTKTLGVEHLYGSKKLAYDVHALFSVNRYLSEVHNGVTEDEPYMRIQAVAGRSMRAGVSAGYLEIDLARNHFRQLTRKHEVEEMENTILEITGQRK